MATDKTDKSINLQEFDAMVKHVEAELPKMMDQAIKGAKELKDIDLPSSNPIQAVSSAYEKWKLNGAIKDLEKEGPEGLTNAVNGLKTTQAVLHLADADKSGSVTKGEIEQTREELKKYRELSGNKKADLPEVMSELSGKGIDSFEKLKEENKSLGEKAELENRFKKMDGMVRSKSDQAEFDKFVDRDGDGNKSKDEISSALETMDKKGLDTLKELKDYNAEHASSAAAAKGVGQEQDKSQEQVNSR